MFDYSSLSLFWRDNRRFLFFYGLWGVLLLGGLMIFADGLGAPLLSWGRFWDVYVLLLPLLFFHRFRGFFFGLYGLFFILLWAFWIYFRIYGMIFPLSFLGSTEHCNGMILSAGFLAAVWSDLLLFLPLAVGVLLSFLFFRTARPTLFCMGGLAVLFPLVFGAVWGIPALVHYALAQDSDCSFAGQFLRDRRAALSRFGMGGYVLYECFFSNPPPISDADRALLAAFFKNQAQTRPLVATPLIQNNLIVVMVESWESWTLTDFIGGRCVMPYCRSLMMSDSCYAVPCIVPQTRDGASSDALLIAMTGLLPYRSSATMHVVNAHTFYSLPHAFSRRGYTCPAFISERYYRSIDPFLYALGFDSLPDLRRAGDDLGLILPDSVFFDRAAEALLRQKEPFMALLFSGGTHTPFHWNTPAPVFSEAEIPGKAARDYANACASADACIEQFINTLKTAGLYDRCTIVLMGDHDIIGRNARTDFARYTIEDRFIPMLILNGPCSGINNRVQSQVNIYPTLLDVCGLSRYPFRGLGYSMRNESAPSLPVYRTGLSADSSQNTAFDALLDLSGLILNSNYFNSHALPMLP